MVKKTVKKSYGTGMQGVTKSPISKSIGPGEPLVIHIHMGGKSKGKEKGETNPDENDMEHEKNESKKEKMMEGELE
jgi:hypothetical protein